MAKTVLQVIGSMNRGGAETFLMNVLRKINRSQYYFIFLCYGDSASAYDEEILKLGARIVRIPDVKDVGIKQHIDDIRRVIVEYNVTTVHAHTYHNSVFSLIAARLCGLEERLTHSHSTQSDTVRASAFKKVYFLISRLLINRLSTQRLACSREAGRALFGRGAIITLLYNGISVKDFVFSKNTRKRLRDEMNIKEDEKVLLHIGRFQEVKNHSFLIEVFDEFQKENSSARLILVGEGPLKKKMQEKAYELGLEGRIIFTGLRTDTASLYCAADIFVMPSLYEGLPLVLVEAQANGLTCLISTSIDASAKITDIVYFQSLNRSAKDWARHLSRLPLEHSRNVAGALLGSEYDMDTEISKIEKIYEGCK